MPLPRMNVAPGLRATCALAILLVAATAPAAPVSWDGPALGGSYLPTFKEYRTPGLFLWKVYYNRVRAYIDKSILD